mmetsp:Transcript_9314/g.15703  ORF Transcript_9314/g.15703 Transcript_9314/m.15703 type:complete len:417 (-) Transcript_9314:351-1601(-)
MRLKLQNSIALKDSVREPEEFYDYEKAVEKIKVDQQIYMIAPTLQVLDPGRQIEMHCFDFKSKENQKVPKYTLQVVDSSDAKLISNSTCAAIIVPQGREQESTFSSEMGRQGLCSQAQCSRIVMIFLGHGHKFDSLKSIQDELNSKILELAPRPCANLKQIPIMTAGDDIGEKSVIDLSQEGIEGFILQDVKMTQQGVALRQVIFESKYDQIQSEIQIVYRDPKKHTIPANHEVQSAQCPKKKGKKAVLNFEFISHEYQQVILTGLFMAPAILDKPLKVLVLGTGAGIMPSFLRAQLQEANVDKIVTVDINENMLKVAEKFFGFSPDEKLESVCDDAFAFVNNSQEKYGGFFDLIIMDINYHEDDLSLSPPIKFLETSFLDKLANLANKKDSLIAMNVVYNSEESKQKVLDNLKPL